MTQLVLSAKLHRKPFGIVGTVVYAHHPWQAMIRTVTTTTPEKLRLQPMNSKRIEEQANRIENLDSRSGAGTTGISSVYALGMSIAVVLSWSRNASILWCILHGLFSWGYVIYFAVTR
jgi:hypothetical protein